MPEFNSHDDGDLDMSQFDLIEVSPEAITVVERALARFPREEAIQLLQRLSPETGLIPVARPRRQDAGAPTLVGELVTPYLPSLSPTWQSQGPSPLIAYAMNELGPDQTKAISVLRETVQDRERHVREGKAYSDLAQAAYADWLVLETQLRNRKTRPRWLVSWFDICLKVLLVAVGTLIGATSLIVGGDPALLALAIFLIISAVTVLAGTHVGIQIRRREEGRSSGLIKTAVATIAVTTAMLFAVRYLTIGPVFGLYSLVNVVASLGAVLLGYLRQDSVSEEIDRAQAFHHYLTRKVRSELNHRAVKRFEAADAYLRPALLLALWIAYERARSSHVDVEPPGEADVNELLSMLVGPEIQSLTPKDDLLTV